MDVSLLPNPASEYNRQRTGVLFTVRSANSPSYSLTRRPGVRKPRGFSEEQRESAGKEGERNDTHTNSSEKEEDVKAAGYQARIGSVLGQNEETDTLGQMSTMLSQNGNVDETITEFGTDRDRSIESESRGRTEMRRYNLPSRSKSLDWKTGVKSPDRGKRADMLVWSTKPTGDIIKPTGGLGGQGRVRSSIQTYYNCTGTRHAQERNPVSHISQTLDRTTRGHSLPSRLRSQSGPCSNVKTSASFGSKGGQSILERIEMLYGSAGFGKTEESNPLTSYYRETSKEVLSPPQPRSYDWTSGGTFPRHLSSGQTSSFRNSVTWTQTDNSGPEAFSPQSRTRERFSGGQWQGQTQGISLSKRLGETGTMSLDRARSRNTVAAKIRAARTAGEITMPQQSGTSSDEWRTASMKEWSRQRVRRFSGSTDWGSTNVTHGILRERAGWLNKQETDDGVKDKGKLKSVSTDGDGIDSNQPKFSMKPFERKIIPEGLVVNSTASVRNKINQFEALTQRSQGSVSGLQRRAFSVPTQLSKAHHGEKKNGSAKATGGFKDRLGGLTEGGGEIEEKGKKLGSERSLSVDEAGLRLARKEGEDLIQSEDMGDDHPKDLSEHSTHTDILDIPVNEGDQKLHRNFYIDESDLFKLSSPEEPSDRPTFLPLSDTSDSPENSHKTKSIMVISPVSDEDKTPTNTPNKSPSLSPTTQPASSTPITENKSTSILTQEAKTPEEEASPVPQPFSPSPHSNLPDLVSPDVNEVFLKGKKQVLDLDAWVAGLSPTIKVWEDNEYEDDDDSTQKDEDSNYDSDSGESSVTITSNMSQSDRRSFCVSLSDLCNFAGVDYESENDIDEWQSVGQRSASLSSDMSALSCVSVLPTEELDKLLEDVRNLGDSTLQDYNDVQVVVLHKEMGVGLGFSLAGGIDQNKPVTVHKVFHLGVAAQEGSIRAGDQVLSINGTALGGYAHWEAVRVLRRAKTRDLGVVVLRRGEISINKGGVQKKSQVATAAQAKETGQLLCVRLEKNSRDLGFSLEGGVGSSLEDRPLTVQKIFQGGPLDKVRPGDEVVEIEGVSMVGMRRLEVWTLIRRLPPGPVDVVLRRPLKHLET
ncbi:uncharacterized protein si:dkey-92i15.4 [Cheilinus undulatus]|uniref:uncharacterized protein si:dkey-92i15.4 n=1 Tax=Cheilinus undulatus TaxID=241271 RepID=UPI001BD243FC|nr:uncharacterized protein si:dkey-92i15.4 [Cheilinus undulatus]XP_041650060.1 uncharacterized protein si:dkey-92i15.4 [Cheilinus undulatus]XP_041650061.1 uncharacterized protein si:dkey-92i15.4 [Cheilinus undulatus]